MSGDIAASIVSALADENITLYQSESEVQTKPYCVYDITTTEHRTKDGVYKVTGDVTIRAISDSASEAKALADDIEDVLSVLSGTAGDTGLISIWQRSRTPDCLDGIWTVELIYVINQYLNN